MTIQYNSLDKFLSLTVQEVATPVTSDFLAILGVICTRKSGEPSGEPFVDIVDKAQLATYTEDLYLEKYFEFGGTRMLLIFSDTANTVAFDTLNFSMGTLITTYEAGYDLTTIPADFKRNKAIESNLLSDASNQTFALQYGNSLLYQKEGDTPPTQLGFQYAFYGKFYNNNFAVPIAFSFGTQFAPFVISNGETQTLRSQRYTFLVEDRGVGELAYASAGALALSDFFYLQQLEISLQNAFKQFLQINSVGQPLAYIDTYIGAIEGILQEVVDSYIALNKLAGGVVSIPRRENQTTEDIQKHLLNFIKIATIQSGMIAFGEGTITSEV